MPAQLPCMGEGAFWNGGRRSSVMVSSYGRSERTPRSLIMAKSQESKGRLSELGLAIVALAVVAIVAILAVGGFRLRAAGVEADRLHQRGASGVSVDSAAAEVGDWPE